MIHTLSFFRTRQIHHRKHGRFVSKSCRVLYDEFAMCEKTQKVEDQSMNKKNCHGRFVSIIAVFRMMNVARVKNTKSWNQV